MGMDRVTCVACRAGVEAKCESTFLGFKKYKCPSCGGLIVLDLRATYRILYWLMLAAGLWFCVRTVMKGGVPVPGLIGVLVVYALVKDWMVRRRSVQTYVVGGATSGRASQESPGVDDDRS